MVRSLKIETLELSWFRGASESASLETNGKNVVLYGSNGSGKSSFVDGLEYIISDGRIEHLAHEYSGRRQEASIINTQIPDGVNSKINLTFTNNDSINVEIDSEGNKTATSEPEDLIEKLLSWRTENYILRQDEVAKFIHLRKGEKYSVLLPLLGLEELGIAADNFKRLHQRVTRDSEMDIVKNNLDRINGNIRQHFQSSEDHVILDKLSELCSDYKVVYTGEIKKDTHVLLKKINKIIEDFTPENSRFQLLTQCRNEELQEKFDSYSESKSKLAEVASKLIDKKIEVLNASQQYMQEIDEKGEIMCPACGQVIDSEEFQAHIDKEMSELEEARNRKEQYERAEKSFIDSFTQVLNVLSDVELQTWMKDNDHENIVQKVLDLNSMIEQAEPIGYQQEIITLLTFIEGQLVKSPPEIKDLLSHKDMLKTIRLIPGVRSLETYYIKIETTVEFLQKCEILTQVKIREKAETKTHEMTEKLQEFWVKIHPDEPIEDVRLYIPQGSDKAIDVSLKFYGVEQPSPRVTLSEGHRNSLGLCIFLALALSQETDDPIILDDIVSSLDREHRNRFTYLLKDELAGRQIILFTHDRDYYTELRYLLPHKDWKFLALSPWIDPTTGIQWARASYSFDDARALLTDYPESSGNRARAIMDSNMSVVAEKLMILLPHLRSTRNDRRTCVEFLERTIPIAETSLKIKLDGDYSIYNDAVNKLREAQRLILAYGNPASHGREVVPGEVTDLIDSCEAALDAFRCPDCGEYVWMADIDTRKRYQCPCGKIRWQYG